MDIWKGHKSPRVRPIVWGSSTKRKRLRHIGNPKIILQFRVVS